MKKFEEELKKEKNPWIKRIGKYLLSRDDIKENLKKENKSLKECFDYILIELSKKCKREGNAGFIAGDDEEIFAMAVHYYDEDDIKLGKKNFTTNADGTATADRLNNLTTPENEKLINEKAIDRAVKNALEEYKREEKKKEKQKKEEARRKKEEAKAKKEAEKKNNDQLDIFYLMGDEDV